MIAKEMILEVDGGYRSHPKSSESHPNRITSDGK